MSVRRPVPSCEKRSIRTSDRPVRLSGPSRQSTFRQSGRLRREPGPLSLERRIPCFGNRLRPIAPRCREGIRNHHRGCCRTRLERVQQDQGSVCIRKAGWDRARFLRAVPRRGPVVFERPVSGWRVAHNHHVGRYPSVPNQFLSDRNLALCFSKARACPRAVWPGTKTRSSRTQT